MPKNRDLEKEIRQHEALIRNWERVLPIILDDAKYRLVAMHGVRILENARIVVKALQQELNKEVVNNGSQ